MANSEISVDALMPAEMAAKAEATGIRKAGMNLSIMAVMSMLAGAFIAAGAFFSTTIVAGASGVLPYGIIRLLAGGAFCIGLILVIVAGAELFTGNNLIIMAWADQKVTTAKLLENWGVVWVGNFVGAVLTALLMFASRQYTFGAGSVGYAALSSANTKAGLDFWQAIALGILCNALGLHRRVALLQRPHHDGQDPLDHFSHHRVRRLRLRAQCGEHVLHPDGLADQELCAGELLGRDQTRTGRLPESDDTEHVRQ